MYLTLTFIAAGERSSTAPILQLSSGMAEHRKALLPRPASIFMQSKPLSDVEP